MKKMTDNELKVLAEQIFYAFKLLGGISCLLVLFFIDKGLYYTLVFIIFYIFINPALIFYFKR